MKKLLKAFAALQKLNKVLQDLDKSGVDLKVLTSTSNVLQKIDKIGGGLQTAMGVMEDPQIKAAGLRVDFPRKQLPLAKRSKKKGSKSLTKKRDLRNFI